MPKKESVESAQSGLKRVSRLLLFHVRFERLREGPYRDHFELQKHTATRPIDLQKLLLLYEPHIVHFSGHGSKREKLILGSTPGRGKTVDRDGLASVFALYKEHLQLVFLNAFHPGTSTLNL